jgi:hypothetical protein
MKKTETEKKSKQMLFQQETKEFKDIHGMWLKFNFEINS